MNLSLVQAAPFLWLLLAVVLEIGGTGDEMERRMSAGGDLL